MTRISIPDARTLLGQTREENHRLREELAKVREVNEAQAEHIARLTGRMCLACGKNVSASHGRAEPGPDCSSPDACTFDLTQDEAWQHWRKQAHDLREQLRKAQEKLRTCRVDTLEEAARLVWSEDEDRPWEHWGQDRNVAVAQSVSREIAAAIRAIKEQPK